MVSLSDSLHNVVQSVSKFQPPEWRDATSPLIDIAKYKQKYTNDCQNGSNLKRKDIFKKGCTKAIEENKWLKTLLSLTDEQMTQAMEVVKSGEFGINRSAVEYGVSKMTLKDRTTGRVKHDTKPGPVAYLDPSEEEELENFCSCVLKWCMEVQREKCYRWSSLLQKKGVAIHFHKLEQRWPTKIYLPIILDTWKGHERSMIW